MSRSDAKLDLHEALGRGSFDNALLCTFTFEPSFFEQHCLEKFKSLINNGNVTVMVDQRVYESLLLEESERPKKANIRYLLQPVSAGRAFHSKIFLLASRNKGRLIIGSANLTRVGITSNAEMVASFEYEEGKDEAFKPLFVAVSNYFTEIARRSSTTALDGNLTELAQSVPWLIAQEPPTTPAPVFLHNLDEPIWNQLSREVAVPVDTVFILSRYFDAYPSLLDELDRMLSPKKIKIFSQNGITNMTPAWLSHPLVKSRRAEIFVCRFSDADHAQPLHAKAMAFQTGNKFSLVFGSANFTSAALLRTIRDGNAETVLMIKDISLKAVKPARLFDPDGTAVLLEKPEMLQTAPREDPCVMTDHILRLHEASLNNDRVFLDADVPEKINRDGLFVNLRFQNFADRSLKLESDEIGGYSARVSDVEKQRMDTDSTMIQLVAKEETEAVATSNWLLITNLKDIKTDRPLRKERHLKEAEQSAVQFFAVLRELLESDDQEALRTFLEFCNIPLIGITRPVLFRRKQPLWDGGAGMRQFGAKNLDIYKELHDLALGFFDRHFRKLRRHVEARTLEGVANFLHIFLAMAGILRAQMERSVIGLESTGSAATSAQWAECRKHWDTYFDRFGQLMKCLGTEYVFPMIGKYGISKIKQEFGPDLEPIHDVCSNMLGYRDRIEKFRTTKLKRVDSARRITVPGYFYSVLSTSQWPRYSQDVGGVLERLESTLGHAA
jgi:HKD family nuclease